MGEVVAVCISEKKGTAKKNVGECRFLENYGLEKDAHAGNWHRQVSLLSWEAVEKFRQRGADVADGAFGENLLVKGYDFKTYPVGSIFQCNDVVLEITQIGKQCHSECEIFHMVGDCIMPREGVFAKVLHGGVIHVGDELKFAGNGCVKEETTDGLCGNNQTKQSSRFLVGVITASDKGSLGQREDLSGPAICEALDKEYYEVVSRKVLPDDEDSLYKEMVRLADEEQVDVIFTTGGTGLSPRDCTPEATLRAATQNVPGIAEAIRYYSLQVTPRAMLSRAVSVMRNRTLIINLPGSPKAVKESLGFILPSLEHGIKIMRGEEGECARHEPGNAG